MGEEQGEGDSMPPQATIPSSRCWPGPRNRPVVASLVNLIALILTFSHQREGTLVRYVAAILKRSTTRDSVQARPAFGRRLERLVTVGAPLRHSTSHLEGDLGLDIHDP